MADKSSKNSMVLQNVRGLFLDVWTPKPAKKNKDGSDSGEKYGGCFLIPKKGSENTLREINRITQELVKEKGWIIQSTGAIRPDVKLPIHDGDTKINTKTGELDTLFAGCWYVNASTYRKPKIVDRKVQPILDQEELQSGDYMNIDVFFTTFDNDSKGVRACLNSIQKVSTGQRIGGSRSPEEAFQTMDDEPTENVW